MLIDLDIDVMKDELKSLNYEIKNNSKNKIGHTRFNQIIHRIHYLTGYIECYKQYFEKED
jgi:hypothetical protein